MGGEARMAPKHQGTMARVRNVAMFTIPSNEQTLLRRPKGFRIAIMKRGIKPILWFTTTVFIYTMFANKMAASYHHTMRKHVGDFEKDV